MSVPSTVFSADECQALLDYIERLEQAFQLPAGPTTPEEIAALDKLREAGKFYVPEVEAFSGVIFYFGCLRESGHYLWLPSGSRTVADYDQRLPVTFPCRLSTLDSGFLPPRAPQDEGVARIWQTDGWTILAFWDRSVDSRPGSNSAFVLEGDLSFEEATAAARGAYPEVWARLKFEVRDAAGQRRSL